MDSDWKTYLVFFSEGGGEGSTSGGTCRLATRQHFIGKNAAVDYANRELKYLETVGGLYAIIPLSEVRKARIPLVNRETQYCLDLEGDSLCD